MFTQPRYHSHYATPCTHASGHRRREYSGTRPAGRASSPSTVHWAHILLRLGTGNSLTCCCPLFRLYLANFEGGSGWSRCTIAMSSTTLLMTVSSRGQRRRPILPLWNYIWSCLTIVPRSQGKKVPFWEHNRRWYSEYSVLSCDNWQVSPPI